MPRAPREGPAKSSAARRIPEEVQAPIRSRLRFLRQMRGMTIQACGFGSGTMTRYELHDISSIALGDLFHFADVLGMTPIEFISYLLGDDEPPETEGMHLMRRISLYLRSLNPERQELAMDLLRVVVDHQARLAEGPTSHSLHVRSPLAKRSSRAALAERAERAPTHAG